MQKESCFFCCVQLHVKGLAVDDLSLSCFCCFSFGHSGYSSCSPNTFSPLARVDNVEFQEALVRQVLLVHKRKVHGLWQTSIVGPLVPIVESGRRRLASCLLLALLLESSRLLAGLASCCALAICG